MFKKSHQRGRDREPTLSGRESTPGGRDSTPNKTFFFTENKKHVLFKKKVDPNEYLNLLGNFLLKKLSEKKSERSVIPHSKKLKIRETGISF